MQTANRNAEKDKPGCLERKEGGSVLECFFDCVFCPAYRRGMYRIQNKASGGFCTGAGLGSIKRCDCGCDFWTMGSVGDSWIELC